MFGEKVQALIASFHLQVLAHAKAVKPKNPREKSKKKKEESDDSFQALDAKGKGASGAQGGFIASLTPLSLPEVVREPLAMNSKEFADQTLKELIQHLLHCPKRKTAPSMGPA